MSTLDTRRDGTVVKCDLAAEVLRSFGSLRVSATEWSMLLRAADNANLREI